VEDPGVDTCSTKGHTDSEWPSDRLLHGNDVSYNKMTVHASWKGDYVGDSTI
jgi:hypothetical protein